MSRDYTFATMPSVSISRSRFARKSQHKTTFNLGRVVPLYVDEVLPGDTRSLDFASLIRMSTPVAPIMDNIVMDVYAFFVPNRIVWDHWKEFMGENNTSAGIPAQTYKIPVLSYTSDGALGSFETGSLGDYMGLPVGVDLVGQGSYSEISALPFRGYAKIINRWFTNQNLVAPIAVQTGDDDEVIVGESEAIEECWALTKHSVFIASKLPDYFVKALPYAQKGSAITVPMGTSAPIKTSAELQGKTGVNRYTGQLYFAQTGGAPTAGTAAKYETDGALGDASGLSKGFRVENFYADLSQATAVTINQLRYAFQLQKLLEKDSLYGTRYWEILNAHFGITAPDASLQDPEYLGGKRFNINVDQVLQTTGYNATPGSNQLGTPGANSVTAGKGSLFTKSFVEHGYIFVLGVARHESTYGQGINRMWTRSGRYDFYWPVFANLGAQDVKVREIYAQGSSQDNDLFGYQEAWAEYRYKPSICTGLLRPNVTGNLGFWTLSENFASKPTLSTSFIQQGRGNLSRALVTGDTGPDFIADFYFEDIAVRPMPVYSIPGLVDHH